jgi:hypothetical protein
LINFNENDSNDNKKEIKELKVQKFYFKSAILALVFIILSLIFYNPIEAHNLNKTMQTSTDEDHLYLKEIFRLRMLILSIENKKD